MTQYMVQHGLNYPVPGADDDVVIKRAEAGDVVDDLPERSIPWLLDNGHIEVHEPDAEVAALVADAESEATAPEAHDDEAGE